MTTELEREVDRINPGNNYFTFKDLVEHPFLTAYTPNALDSIPSPNRRTIASNKFGPEDEDAKYLAEVAIRTPVHWLRSNSFGAATYKDVVQYVLMPRHIGHGAVFHREDGSEFSPFESDKAEFRRALEMAESIRFAAGVLPGERFSEKTRPVIPKTAPALKASGNEFISPTLQELLSLRLTGSMMPVSARQRLLYRRLEHVAKRANPS